MAEVHRRLAEADQQDAQRGPMAHEVLASVFIRNSLELEEQQRVFSYYFLDHLLILCNHRRQLALIIEKKSTKSDIQKASIQEKRNVLMRQIRRWQQVQLVYMPGVTISSLPAHDHDTEENDTGDLEPPEKIPLILLSKVELTQRNMVCLYQVANYERQLRLAQLQDSLIELRRVR